ncbi:MAG TPA: glycosyltransferase family 9 protein [Candidatus Synoicihabitans sp.]|nr:glycosyltransferase family 9 protein [Candidatus Synoicihabitans sp.]
MGAENAQLGPLCLLRLSAIGDVAHTVAVVRTLQARWPGRPLLWLVGRTEAAVASLVDGVEVVVVDKRRPFAEARRLRRQLAQHDIAALLHMQVSLRANVISLGVRARRRIGFDRARAKEGHGWVINQRISAAPPPGEHVVDGLMRFPAALGAPTPVYRWDLQLPREVRDWASQRIDPVRALVAINVCASRPVKDWTAQGFAAVATHAANRHQAQVVLCGGPTAHERTMAAAIETASGVPIVNLVGATTLPQLIAVLERAAVLVSPDSGPVHLATAVGTPVIGLYGATNLARCGPYLERRWCVDRRAEAAQKLLGKRVDDLRWSEVVAGGMSLIEPDAVIARLDAAFAERPGPGVKAEQRKHR